MDNLTKTIISIHLVILFMSCGKDKPLIDKKIAEYINQNAHNPQSYQPVSTILKDTMKAESIIENMKWVMSMETDSFQKNQDDSLIKSLNPDSITGYRFIHQFRITVPLGGMMLKTATVETDTAFNIRSFKEN